MHSITLSRYFAGRFFVAVTAVFVGIFVLVALVDYIDLVRKAARRAERAGLHAGADIALPRARRSWSACCRSAC